MDAFDLNKDNRITLEEAREVTLTLTITLTLSLTLSLIGGVVKSSEAPTYLWRY